MKAFVVYNLLFCLCSPLKIHTNLLELQVIKLFLTYKQNTILKQNNHTTIGYLLPYSCSPEKYSDIVHDILGQKKR